MLTTPLLTQDHSVRNALATISIPTQPRGGRDDLLVAQLKAAGHGRGLSVSNTRFDSPGRKVTPWETDHLAVDGSCLDTFLHAISHPLADVGNRVCSTASSLLHDRSLPSVCESTALVEPQRAKFYCLCCGKKFGDKDFFSYDCCQERSIQRIRTHHLQENSPGEILPENDLWRQNFLSTPNHI